jgi:hypothetical protein
MASPTAHVRYKVFNDSIHGAIELHPLSARIIDTVEYQRLRRLKQLGGAYSVFPAASHNRFEHCLGVAWMAQRFIKHLAEKQPELAITPLEMLCVEVAGLVHDLGHGVMSHMFDAKFIPAVHGHDCKWQHEFASVGLLRLLFEKNPDVAEEAKAWGVDEAELHFMQELVLGGPGKRGEALPAPNPPPVAPGKDSQRAADALEAARTAAEEHRPAGPQAAARPAGRTPLPPPGSGPKRAADGKPIAGSKPGPKPFVVKPNVGRAPAANQLPEALPQAPAAGKGEPGQKAVPAKKPPVAKKPAEKPAKPAPASKPKAKESAAKNDRAPASKKTSNQHSDQLSRRKPR